MHNRLNCKFFLPTTSCRSVIRTHVCRVAPDWDLWRTAYRLSYSSAARQKVFFVATNELFRPKGFFSSAGNRPLQLKADELISLMGKQENEFPLEMKVAGNKQRMAGSQRPKGFIPASPLATGPASNSLSIRSADMVTAANVCLFRYSSSCRCSVYTGSEICRS